MPAPHKQRFKYPTRDRCAVQALTCVFILFSAAFIIVGQTLGPAALPGAIVGLSGNLGDKLFPLMRTATANVNNFVIQLASDALAPALVNANATLQGAVDLTAVDESVGCVIDTIDNLPDIAGMVTAANSMAASATSLTGNLTTLTAAVTNIIYQQGNVSNAVTSLSGSVSSLQAALPPLQSSLAGTAGALETLAATQAALVGSGSASGGGYIGSVQVDVAKLQPGAGMPTAAEVQAAAGSTDITNISGDGSLTRLINGTMNGNVSDVQLLVAHLQTINSSLTTGIAANYSVTADALAAINALAAATGGAGGSLAALVSAIGEVAGALAALPDTAGFNAPLTTLASIITAFTVDPVLQPLSEVQSTLDALPNITALIAQLDELNAVSAIIPCARGITDQIATINASLVTLPGAVTELVSQLDAANATIAEGLQSVQQAKTLLADAQSQLAAVNVSDYQAKATGMAELVNATAATLNISAVQARIAALAPAVNVNFTSLLANITTINVTLASYVPSPSLVAALRGFETARRAVLSSLATQLEQYSSLAFGYCSGDTSISCAQGSTTCSDASAGACTAPGSYRCAASPQQACVADATCSGITPGDVCLADAARAAALQELILGIPGAVPDTAAALTQLADVQAAVVAVDVASQVESVASANASIADVDASGVQADLASVNASLATFDSASVQSTLANVLSSIDDIDFSSYTAQLNDIADSVQTQVSDNRELLGRVQEALQLGINLLNVRLPDYVQLLSRSSLTSVLAANGTAGLLLQVATVGQTVLDLLADNQSCVDVPTIDIVSQIPADFIDRVTATGSQPDAMNFGVVYYIMNTINWDLLVPATAPGAKSVFYDASGDRYYDAARGYDQYCLTSACITATVESYTTPSIYATSDTIVPLYITPLEASALVWLAPAVVLILALLALVCPLATSGKSDASASRRGSCCDAGWQKVPAAWMTGCIICQLPCIFLFAGALAFPLILAFGDACASGPNAGYNLLLQPGINNHLCALAYGNSGSASACVYNASLELPDGSSVGIDTTVDLLSVYTTVLADECPPTDPWAPAVASVLSQLQTVPYERVVSFLTNSSTLADAGVVVKPPLLQLAVNATNATALAVAGFVSALFADTVTCAPIQTVVDTVSDVACYSLLSPLYWYVTAWYMLAWAFCCCGLPAGILGRKRLPPRVWGSLAVPVTHEPEGLPADLDDVRDAPGGNLEVSQVNPLTAFRSRDGERDDAGDPSIAAEAEQQRQARRGRVLQLLKRQSGAATPDGSSVADGIVGARAPLSSSDAAGERWSRRVGAVSGGSADVELGGRSGTKGAMSSLRLLGAAGAADVPYGNDGDAAVVPVAFTDAGPAAPIVRNPMQSVLGPHAASRKA